MQPKDVLISGEEKTQLISYMDELGVSHEGKLEIIDFIDKGDHRAIKERFDFYLQLAEKKEVEFFRVQQLIYAQELKEISETGAQGQQQDIENLAKIQSLEDAISEDAIDRYYSKVEDDIDKINQATIREMIEFLGDVEKAAEEKSQIESIKDKLK